MLTDTTLVLGGGGLWGVAWMTGLILGLEESGLDVRHPRAVIGTSAGSVVGAHVTSSFSTEELFQRQAIPHKQPRQRAPDPKNQQAAFAVFLKSWSDPDERLRAICDLALNTQSIPWALRRADIVERLGLERDAWPSTPLTITAVDVDARALRTFDAASGVSLADAIGASCAVPGIWPIAEIASHRYIDGGVWRTAENAQLATGAPFVLILSPLGGQQSAFSGPALPDDIAQLRAGGSKVALIAADEMSLATIGPAGPLDPATRKPAAEAGRMQGRREALTLKEAFV